MSSRRGHPHAEVAAARFHSSMTLSGTTGSRIRMNRSALHGGPALTCLAYAFLLGACGDGGPSEPKPPAIASITIVSPTDTLRQQDVVRLSAHVIAEDGSTVMNPVIEWRSDRPGIAVVAADGSVTGVGRGRTWIRASIGGRADSVALEVRVRWKQVTLTRLGSTSCGLAVDGQAFCWGRAPHRVAAGLTVMQTVPDSVPGGLRFEQLASTWATTCGVERSGAVYCWGADPSQPGVSNVIPTPVTVATPLASVIAGHSYFCGLSQDGRAFCWGGTESGRLGTGTEGPVLVPTEVLGGLRFKLIQAGIATTCAIATSGEPYCWGWNEYGQAGVGDSPQSTNQPVRVQTTRAFIDISPGYYATCGVAVGGSGFCWGLHPIGDGLVHYTPARSPVGVYGAHRFAQISVGEATACGRLEDGTAYCWGVNLGGFGNGRTEASLTPVPVSGGHRFKQLAVSSYRACGIDLDGILYCWGWNTNGALGDGTETKRLVPVPVAEPPLQP